MDKISKVYILASISGGNRYVLKAFSNYLAACDYIDDTLEYFKEQGYNAPEIQRIIDPYTVPTQEPTIIEVYQMKRGADCYTLELYSVEPIRGEYNQEQANNTGTPK